MIQGANQDLSLPLNSLLRMDELLSTVSSLPLDITLGRDSSPLTDELSLISCHYTSSLHKGNKAENCTLTHSKAVGAQLS